MSIRYWSTASSWISASLGDKVIARVSPNMSRLMPASSGTMKEMRGGAAHRRHRAPRHRGVRVHVHRGHPGVVHAADRDSEDQRRDDRCADAADRVPADSAAVPAIIVIATDSTNSGVL